MSQASRRAAVFLDRDGTLVEEEDYLSDPDRVRLIPGAADALRRLRDAGFALVIITNQSGIARGFYTERDYRAVQDRIEAEFQLGRVRFDAVFHCPHHPDFTGPCRCRKPGTLLYEQAIQELGLAPDLSWYVGDRWKDLEPARILGGRGLLVRTGYGREQGPGPAEFEAVDDIVAAADRILQFTKG